MIPVVDPDKPTGNPVALLAQKLPPPVTENAAGTLLTVTTEDVMHPKTLYVILAVPEATPVTAPEVTVATVVLELVHIPPGVVLDNRVELVGHTVKAPVSAAGIGLTVMVLVAEFTVGVDTHPVAFILILTVFPFASEPFTYVVFVAPATGLPFNSHWKVGVPPFTGVAVKVTVVPAQIAPAGDAATVTDGTAAACRDKEAQFVAGDNPAIPAEEVGLILPAAEVVFVAWICTPLIEKKSVIEVPLVVTLIVIVVVVIPPSVIAVIFLPGRKLRVIAAAVLNSQPAGVLSTSECGPVVMSFPKPSEKTIFPRVLNAGVLPS